MTSSGGDVPAERAAAAVNEIVEAREGVEKLKSFLMQLDHRPPWVELEADGVLSRLSNAMSALDVAGASAVAGVQSPAAVQSDGARPQPSPSSSGNTRKRGFSKRSRHASEQSVITDTLDDGHIWRKYGQKEIQNSPYPRSYFRCTHKSDRGCPAKRHVQRCEADPSKHVVTYYGDHTCNDPFNQTPAPLVIHAAAAPGDGGAGNLMISFAASRADATNANNAGVSPTQQQSAMDGTAATNNTMSMSTSWFSSSAGSFAFLQADELGAVVGGSAAAVSSTRTAAAPGSALPVDNGGTMPWPTGGGGAGSFPSSPNNSIGFEVGEDDFFRFRYP